MEEQINKEMLKEMVYTTPLALTLITDQNKINFINKALPYSTGFEVESYKGEYYKEENFKSIPDIMFFNYSDSDGGEFRFRVPNGIVGIICIYNITEQLKQNCEINKGGSIHYHIDMTDCFHLINEKFVKENEEWMLEELETWGDDLSENGKHCRINIRGWVQFQTQFKTCEIRIGEIVFDYEIIIQRILHANKIVKKLKDKLLGYHAFDVIKYPELDNSKINMYISKHVNELSMKLNDMKSKLSAFDVKYSINDLKKINTQIQNRIIKL